ALTSRRATFRAIADHLQGWLEERCKAWRDGDLRSVFDRHTEAPEKDVEKQAEGFLANVDRIRQALAPALAVTNSEEDISNANRVLAAVGGFVAGGVGSAIEGASMGFKGMAKGLAVNIGVSVGLLVLGFGIPIVLPVLAVIGVARTLINTRSAIEQM